MLKISTDIFSASVKKRHNTHLQAYTRYGSGGMNRIGLAPFQDLADPVA
jgi:hypothetical protein